MPAQRKRDGERMRDAGRSKPRDPNEHLDATNADFLRIPVVAPSSNPQWHPIARAWFESLKTSGQSMFYEPSDWAFALTLAEAMSRDFGPVYVRTRKVWVAGFYEDAPEGEEKRYGTWRDGHYEDEEVFEQTTIKPASITAYIAGMNKLLATEADRRTFRVQVDRPVPDEGAPHLASVTDIAATRDELLNEGTAR